MTSSTSRLACSRGLGAVDATGRVVETVGHDAFGQRTDGTVAAQSHRFAGEYWDEDAQLVYLRARWYDPRVGRFISGDPFEGRQGDPRSLNRYGYAHNDPVHNADPSGKISFSFAGAAFATLVTASFLALANHLAHTQNRASIWDAIVATRVRADSGVYNKPLPPEQHHTIPIYLCGSIDQRKPNIDWADHKLIHFGLGLIWVNVALAEEAADRLVPFARRRTNEVMRFAKTEYGRNIIAGLIELFYEQGGFLELGRPITIKQALEIERPPYVRGTKTSLPSCVRSK